MLRNSRAMAILSLSLLVLALGPMARTLAVQASPSIRPFELPSLIACSSLHGWAPDWSPTFVDPDYSIADSYQCDGYRVHISVVQYLEQHQGKEAVGESNSVIPRAWWNATKRRQQRVAPDLEVNEYCVDRAAMRMTIWSWYAVGVQPTSSGVTAKAMEAFDALRLRSRPTTSFTVAVEADPRFDASTVMQTDVPGIWSWFVAEMRVNG